jgi:hypothetical protein
VADVDKKYLRRASLVVASVGGAGLDLSATHFRFNIRQWDLQTPNSASFRVYNLAAQTVNQIQNEFTRLTLQVGYQGGDFGTIFDGTIVQAKRGNETAADSYLDIVAADGDEATNFAVVNTAVAAGSDYAARASALVAAMGLQDGYKPTFPAGTLPRGRTYYGMAKDHMRDVALGTDTKWSVQNGLVQFVPLGGYLPGEAVVLTSSSGLIGFPEQTQDGIRVRCLIDPKIKVGCRVKIDNKSIQRATLNLSIGGSATNAFLPSIADDGFYRVLVNELEGDIRGEAWYNNLICIAMNEAATPALIAKGYS